MLRTTVTEVEREGAEAAMVSDGEANAIVATGGGTGIEGDGDAEGRGEIAARQQRNERGALNPESQKTMKRTQTSRKHVPWRR